MDLETVSWCPERTVFNLHTWAALQEHFVFLQQFPHRGKSLEKQFSHWISQHAAWSSVAAGGAG